MEENLPAFQEKIKDIFVEGEVISREICREQTQVSCRFKKRDIFDYLLFQLNNRSFICKISRRMCVQKLWTIPKIK